MVIINKALMKFLGLKTVLPIAAIFSFRMLGLFLLIPVFTLYAGNLQGATPMLIGFALGAYGLTQGLLQMPFGLLSDKVGRKPIIALGLVLFAAGSVLGAFTHSIYGMIIARTIQGTGAIGSVLIALLADVTEDAQRTKAMALVGMSIGVSFGLAMVLSPVVAQHLGLAGIFYLTALLACVGLVLLYGVIPNPPQVITSGTASRWSLIQSALRNPALQKLDAGIFCQHFILTATFFATPMVLTQQSLHGHLSAQWQFYLPLVMGSFILMLPLIVWAEKRKAMQGVFAASVAIVAGSQLLLAFTHGRWLPFCCLMFAYFVVFNFLEAALPSLVSKKASAHNKGTAMGVYSTAQFLGIFAGGASAGLLYQCAGNQAIFLGNALVAGLWFLLGRIDTH